MTSYVQDGSHDVISHPPVARCCICSSLPSAWRQFLIGTCSNAERKWLSFRPEQLNSHMHLTRSDGILNNIATEVFLAHTGAIQIRLLSLYLLCEIETVSCLPALVCGCNKPVDSAFHLACHQFLDPPRFLVWLFNYSIVRVKRCMLSTYKSTAAAAEDGDVTS